MTSVQSSQSLILTTAMAVSGAVIFLSLFRFRNLSNHSSDCQSPNHTSSSLRSCLSSDGKKGEKKKSKKKVKFADNVKDEGRSKVDNGSMKKTGEICKIGEIPQFCQMPANRIALYNGILRDRVQRIEC